MRDIILFLAIFSLVPISLKHPYYGLLAWAWLSFMNPHRLTWGSAHDFPFVLLISAATLAGFIIMVMRDRDSFKLSMQRETVLLLLLWLLFTISTIFALYPELAWPEWSKISKILIFSFLIIILVDTEQKLRGFLLVTALSFGFYGFKGGLFSTLTGGNFRVWGPEGTFIADNNAMGLALNMTLPILWYLGITEKNKYLRHALFLTFTLSLLAVIFTYSRGAFLGLAVVLLSIIMSLKFRSKMIIGVALFFLLPAAISQIPDQWFDRMNTIQTYDEDASAVSRLASWTTAYNVALDYPLTGGGFQVIDKNEIHYMYGEEKYRGAHVSGVHSIYLEVLGENGFVTFIVFVSLIFFTVMKMKKTRKLYKNKKIDNLFYYSHIPQISILAYAVSGAFLELASFDLFYTMVSLGIVINVLVVNNLKSEQENDLRGHNAHSFNPHSRL